MDASNTLFIIGPTAAGKSARAMGLALARDGEIVSADSRHVYRGMDIGTNKPTARERAAVRHHVLDLRDPDQDFSLAEYLALARAAIADAQARGKLAIVVGGTGQYVRALIEGWQTPEVPPNPEFRRRMEAVLAERGAGALEAMLRARDPDALKTIDPRNARRVIRALEVIEATGQKWSDSQRRAPLRLRADQLIYLLVARDELYARADARIERMMAEGWLDEVRALLERLRARGVGAEAAFGLPAMSALGYRQMMSVALGRMSLDDALADIKRDTRRFIRSQDVWGRKIAALVGDAERESV